MTAIYTIEELVRKLDAITNHEEKLYKILELYMELFPVQDASLYRYSPIGYFAEGIISLSSKGLSHIREKRDDARSYNILQGVIRERKAKYCSGIEFFKQTSSNYAHSSNDHALLVSPICYGSVVIGLISSKQFHIGATIDEDLLTSATLYGKLVGRVIEDFQGAENSSSLSKRELEVMQRIAWGQSTKEMADSMNISELTVKQYVKSAIQKTGANNRSHAVGELYRQGIIS
ncbi:MULTISPECIES: response regulator transcription factor [Brevibacillus]|uniref:LuxR family transcriptional regulator n=1 Tax=Brevibacillus brevis TaxID=1393 RepID=A0A2Z4MIN6_BREBE|nr:MULTISPECIES: helix-turn-helix transcriptional regulator [Brevibacillus]AWX56231.1 LuxR family transcriptional regulator [Brevibacillus brevis]NRR22628.1 helix-turn-helix transcriptional regulator [Brevibacillus sp. MS2.2]